MPTPTHILLKLPVSFPIIFHNLVTVILLSTPALGEDDHGYTECRRDYDCGLLKNISYPFWAANGRPQHCGLEDYELTCREDRFPFMKIEDQDFLVLNFRQFYSMTIARSDLWDTPCTDHIVNTTLDYDRFSYVPSVRNLTLLYGCQPGNMSVPNSFACKVKGTDRDDISYYVDDNSSRIHVGNWASCYLNFRVPIRWEGVDVMPDTPDKLKQVLKQGFQVRYEAEWELCRQCLLLNGTCGSKSNSNSFVCYCGDGICSLSGGMYINFFLISPLISSYQFSWFNLRLGIVIKVKSDSK
ncbi:hypothetical protein ACFX19_040099 [Malus domestica]